MLMFVPLSGTDYLKSGRLLTDFDFGRPGDGTCFLVEHEKRFFLITARHLLDDHHLRPGEVKQREGTDGYLRGQLAKAHATFWALDHAAGKLPAIRLELDELAFHTEAGGLISPT